MPEHTFGPWGEDGVMLYSVTSTFSAQSALYEFVGDFDDWMDYAISVEGPLMYHEIVGDYDGRIEPCECEDEHSGQHEVWKVVAQDQEPTARFKERRRHNDRVISYGVGYVRDLDSSGRPDSAKAVDEFLTAIREERLHHA